MKNKDIEKYPLILKALAYFMENPYEEIYLREFGRKLAISPNTSQRFLDSFLDEGFVTEIKKGNLRYFKANMDSVLFRQIKLAYSIKKIEKSGIIGALKGINVSHAVLFGSVAEGKDSQDSDIDLLIIGTSKKAAQEAMRKIEGKMDKEINFHFFHYDEWRDQAEKNRAFYLEVISKGICLIGEKPIID
jgi:uncharacterized protein